MRELYVPEPDEAPESWATRPESFSRLAVESLPHGVLVLTADGTIVIVNRTIERQFGYSRDKLIGKNVECLLSEQSRTPHIADRTICLNDPAAQRLGSRRECSGQRADGSLFPIELRLTPVQTDDGEFVVAAVTDFGEPTTTDEYAPSAADGQLEFERLAAELLVEFINVAPNQVDDLIQAALRRVGETLDLDCCIFARFSFDGQITHPATWEREGIPAVSIPSPAAERFPWAFATVSAGETLCYSTLDEVPNPVDRESCRLLGSLSSVAVPLPVDGRIVGVISFNLIGRERKWRPDEVHRLRVLAMAFANVLARQQSDEALQQTLAEVKHLGERLNVENVYLRREVRERLGTAPFVGKSPAILRVLDQISQVAGTDSTVLLLGETGTGKELLAMQIHESSSRRARPLVRVNCAAIPATLIESELFGREKGAFTGALAKQIGRFELANGSTIFLDEIGDLSPDVQVKLLRVLEERQIERLGSPRPIDVDVRIIGATHRNLPQRIAEGAFRDDLFYRLNVFPIDVPPLRERVEDIPLLIWRFVEEFSSVFGKRIEAISKDSMTALQQYSWPGNIRELRNVIERAMILATGKRLSLALPTAVPGGSAAKRPIKLIDLEKDHILKVLESSGWRIRGSGGAAERLGLKATTLETRMAKLGLKRPRS
jgi:formate hydrogenlyase transcriptional activator